MSEWKRDIVGSHRESFYRREVDEGMISMTWPFQRYHSLRYGFCLWINNEVVASAGYSPRGKGEFEFNGELENLRTLSRYGPLLFEIPRVQQRRAKHFKSIIGMLEQHIEDCKNVKQD